MEAIQFIETYEVRLTVKLLDGSVHVIKNEKQFEYNAEYPKEFKYELDPIDFNNNFIKDEEGVLVPVSQIRLIRPYTTKLIKKVVVERSTVRRFLGSEFNYKYRDITND